MRASLTRPLRSPTSRSPSLLYLSILYGYLAGEHFCDKCAAAHPHAGHGSCEVWTRVVGYFRGQSSTSVGRVPRSVRCSGSAADAHGRLVGTFPPAGAPTVGTVPASTRPGQEGAR